MHDGRRVIAVVPARLGSKGLPGKNMRMLGGRPMSAWTIEAALSSSLVDEVVVTSDDDEVLELATSMGVSSVRRRAPALALDTTPMTAVIDDVIKALASPPAEDGILVLLQPTSPLRTANHIDEALRQMTHAAAEAVIAVCKAEHSPLLMNTLPPDRMMGDFVPPDIRGRNRQELQQYYRINGAMYASSIAYFHRSAGFLGSSTVAFVMRQEDSVDVDTEFDFSLAECVLLGRTERIE